MSATDWLDTGSLMARMGRARVVAPYTLEIVWAEGERGGRTDVVDLSPALGSYRIYRGLRDDAGLFATASVIEDGYALGFSGDAAKVSVDLIEQLADETMSPAEFAAFLKRNKLTQDAAAALLGRSRR